MEDFDTATVAGAIEYIVAYVKETYQCPVFFYTSPKYDSIEYQSLVNLLKEIEKKWDIILINMWNDDAFNAINEEERKLYMTDRIHPSKAGYYKWWLLVFETKLEEELMDNQEGI